MKKILISTLALLLIFGTSLFAEKKSEFAEESIGLTDADCKNYAKNYKKIDEELKKVGAGKDEETYTYSDAIEDTAEIDAILAKYGISEPDRYMKLYWISYGYSIIKTQKELEADPLSYKVMKKTGTDPIPAYKSIIGEDDYNAVVNNYAALKKAFEPESKEPEKKKSATFGDIIGDSLGGKKGKITGSFIDKAVEKKGKSSKVEDHIELDEEDE